MTSPNLDEALLFFDSPWLGLVKRCIEHEHMLASKLVEDVPSPTPCCGILPLWAVTGCGTVACACLC